MSPMAQWSLLVLATFILGAFAAPVIDDPIAFKNATWEKCQKEENAPADAMKDLYIFKSTEGIKDHKCVAKCINEEYGIFEKGTISKEIIDKIIKGLWKDIQAQEKLISISDACRDSVNPELDPCQINYDMFSCFIQGFQKGGFVVV